jgi:site-specific DNA recombinase
MTTIRAAFYARVSSEQQAAAHTIESQTSALSERARSDGTPVPPERQFVDDGISGATLARPALDRLRNLAAVGTINRIYVHSPDPEDDLLLQMQGIIAECERAKFMERIRRGKRHAAQSGSLNVMSCAPFGYRYVSVREGGGKARFERFMRTKAS